MVSWASGRETVGEAPGEDWMPSRHDRFNLHSRHGFSLIKHKCLLSWTNNLPRRLIAGSGDYLIETLEGAGAVGAQMFGTRRRVSLQMRSRRFGPSTYRAPPHGSCAAFQSIAMRMRERPLG
jgi:hypothetical protein